MCIRDPLQQQKYLTSYAPCYELQLAPVTSSQSFKDTVNKLNLFFDEFAPELHSIVHRHHLVPFMTRVVERYHGLIQKMRAKRLVPDALNTRNGPNTTNIHDLTLSTDADGIRLVIILALAHGYDILYGKESLT